MRLRAVFKHWSLRLFAPDRVLQQTYEAFKTLLEHDIKAHELMAEFGQHYHEGRQEDLARSRERYRQLALAVAGMVTSLERMDPAQAGGLRDYFNKYDFYIRLQLAPPEQFLIPPLVVDHETLSEAALVGGKSHHLLRLKQAGQGRVPAGFTVTATTFALLVEHNRLRPAIDLLLAAIDPHSGPDLEAISQALMTLVRRMAIPDSVSAAILGEYDRLADQNPGGGPWVAVRSSALHEDGRHSFAGQYHSVLGVNREGLLAAYLSVLASKYSPQALLYRISTGLGDEEAGMAVLVLTMIDALASGVIYSRDPAGVDDLLLIQAIHGLGLPLVGGEIVPDSYLFSPEDPIPRESIAGSQRYRLVLEQGQLRQRPLTGAPVLALDRPQAMRLAAIARELERFFGKPQDIEWALDHKGEVFILQARPLCQATAPVPPATRAKPHEAPLLTGARRAAGTSGCGRVHHYDPAVDLSLPPGAVLVTRQIPPSLVRFIAQLEAVVCEQGSVTGHFATVCREFGLVLLVEAAGALDLLPPGLEVTVDGSGGAVYAGRVAGLLATVPAAEDRPATGGARRLRAMLDHIAPLHLVDPGDPGFVAQSCRSLHDIIRYAHEKAVQTMFGLGAIASGSSSRCRRLATALPLDIYLLDLGGAFDEGGGNGGNGGGDGGEVGLETIRNPPFLAIWQGLSHPQIDWQSHLHFDWQGFGDMALSGGGASGGAREFASYAILSRDYLNLTMRFGYHFTLVDCLCGGEARANYCQVRFAGGGGDYQGRSLRITLLERIFRRLGFEVSIRGDLLDARVSGSQADDLRALLVTVGRLLGMTKLLDLVLQAEDLDRLVDQFFTGAGSFAAPAG